MACWLTLSGSIVYLSAQLPQGLPKMMIRLQRSHLVNSGILLLVIAASLAITYFYVSSERIFYYFDNAYYQNTTHQIVATYHIWPRAALADIINSVANEYNALYTIPLVPVFLLFGDSRLVYELALTLIYLLPFTLAFAAVMVKVIPSNRRFVFWSTVGLLLLTPTVWVPTLSGVPDTGAAFLLALALLVYLHDPELGHKWQIPLFSLLLASSVLFRRHFIYAIVALLLTLALDAALRFVTDLSQKQPAAARLLLRRGLRIGLTALGTVLVLALLNLSFLQRLLTVDYNSMYAGYKQTTDIMLRFFAEQYGWLAWLFVAAGFASGLSNHKTRSGTLFLLTFGLVSFGQWLVVARQVGASYTLHFHALFVPGLSLLLWTLWSRLRGMPRMVGIAATTLFLLINGLVGLSSASLPISDSVRTLLARNHAPQQRSDYDQVAQLIDTLRNTTNGQPIYLVASSDLFNQDILRNGERMLYGWDQARLNIIAIPEVDSRDYLPLEKLLQAQYVVLLQPFQQHLGVERQGVVKSVYDLFVEQQQFAQDFVRLPSEFSLASGVRASLYQRTKPTSLPTAIRTLHLMQSYLQQRPASQLDWMLINSSPASVAQNANRSYALSIPPSMQQPSSIALIYMGTVPDQPTLSGQVVVKEQSCSAVRWSVSSADAQGQVTPLVERVQNPTDAPAFSLAVPKPPDGNLLLTITPTGPCGLRIERLTLAHG